MDKENQNLISLIIDTQNDVEGAFEKLYHESFRHAYCTASLLLKNEQDIEDVLQSSFMYVAKYIKDLKNPESFNSWLGVIVKHECQKYISKQKHISDIFAAVKKTKEFDLIVDGNLTDEYIEKSELRDAIQRIVDDLPDDKRACVVLFYYEQHSLTEISEILGIPEGTVMSRLFYARKKLEKEFRKLQEKDETLFGVSVIPLVVSLFAYQVKTTVISSAAESVIIAAVTAGRSAAAATTAAVGSGTAAASTAGVTTAGASTAAGAAGTAVAAKVTAVAVAASVAVGGGVATVNHIKNENESVTTKTSMVSTAEHTTAASIIHYETADYTEETTTYIFVSETLSVLSTSATTSVTQITEKTETTETEVTETTTQRKKRQTTTTKTSEETKATTSKPSTTEESTTKETTQQTTSEVQETETLTQKETTTENISTSESTTSLTDVFYVSDGVLSEYTGNEHIVSIPSKVGSSTVTAIGTGAFMGNTEITSVSISSTVTRIGMEAFSDCTNLRSVSLPSSLESIGVAAFYGCSSLTSITIPDGTKTISDEAFSYCTNLSSITIPDSVTSISEDAFYGSDNLTIRCSEGSAAHDYAAANLINFELI